VHLAREDRTARIEIQTVIDSFFASEKRYPRSIGELTEKNRTVSKSIRKLNGDWFDYEPVGTNSYKLRFAFGEKPNAGNVIVLTPEINYQNIAAEIDKEMDQ